VSVSDVISGASSALSILAVWMSYHTYRGTLRSASRPVLVFRSGAGFKWRIENVGTGPAIKVLVIDYTKERRIAGITNCFPLATGAGIDLTWLDDGFELGVVYTDRFGGEYSTTCVHNTNKISDRNELPKLEADVDQWIQQFEGRTFGSAARARELRKKSAVELDLMRNEIYARRGYIFRRLDLCEHFSRQQWYVPVSCVQQEIEALMSPAEKYEAYLIRHVQLRFGLTTEKSQHSNILPM
jgi:hypothetical protein